MTLEHARKIFPPIWVVYVNPADWPGKVVVRCWWGMCPEPTAMVCDTLTDARERIALAGGCVPMMPGAGDDPVIAECWL
jgi:hypothetical protein